MTRNARSEYVETTLDLVGMNGIGSTKKDLKISEIKKSETYVRNTMDAFNNFMNPFEVEDQSSLYCLSSGASVPQEVEQDLMNAQQYGKEALQEFIQERLVDKKKKFHDPIKRQNLKTFSSISKSVKVSNKDKKLNR